MPAWFDDFADLPVIITVLTAGFAVLTYVIKREVDAVKHEMFPNSGKSMRDAVDRIERKLDSHIEWHLDNRE